MMPLLLWRKASIRMMVNDQSMATPSADAQVMIHFRRFQYYDYFVDEISFTGGGSPKVAPGFDASTKLEDSSSVLCTTDYKSLVPPIDC